jgi:hypothetical protein
MATEVRDKDLARNPSPAATAQQGDRRPNTPEAAEVKPTNREARWDNNAGAWYYFNHKTGISQWENPRVPTASAQSYGYDRFANYHLHFMSFSA